MDTRPMRKLRFDRPSFLSGFARVGGAIHHLAGLPLVPERMINWDDAEALKSDWEAVGGDMYAAIEKYKITTQDQ